MKTKKSSSPINRKNISLSSINKKTLPKKSPSVKKLKEKKKPAILLPLKETQIKSHIKILEDNSPQNKNNLSNYVISENQFMDNIYNKIIHKYDPSMTLDSPSNINLSSKHLEQEMLTIN